MTRMGPIGAKTYGTTRFSKSYENLRPLSKETLDNSFIGEEIRLSMRKGHVGKVFAIDRVTGILSVKDRSGKIHLVRT